MNTTLQPRMNNSGALRSHRSSPIRIRLATAADHDAIFRLRHAVFAMELGQYQRQSSGRLPDESVNTSHFIVAVNSVGDLLGFVAVTPPQVGKYGLEKYLGRDRWPVAVTDRLFEIRALTVDPRVRGGSLAALLMYAALRWIEANDGSRIIAMGRREMLPLYEKCGMRRSRIEFTAGSTDYEFLYGSVRRMCERVDRNVRLVDRLENLADWQLDIPLRRSSHCYHGGAFFEAIGEDFRSLSSRQEIINADVLDAWYPPSPRVRSALRDHLPWLLHTSPPTHCEGLVAEIATSRNVPEPSVVVGAGSSDLMFRALPRWIGSHQRVLILDPMYGEYAHILENVIGCRVDRFTLSAERNFRLDLERLAKAIRERRYAACILVNPNSPTGQIVPRCELQEFVRSSPRRTLIWIDETYIDFAGREHSLESAAVGRDNLVICKSMSKYYALSGARVGYLCGHPRLIDPIRHVTPPWVVGLPSQVAAVEALRDPAYYKKCCQRTHDNRARLMIGLAECGLSVIPGCANFILAFLQAMHPTAAAAVECCRKQGLFLRDASVMGSLGDRAIRIAVKDSSTCDRMVKIIRQALS